MSTQIVPAQETISELSEQELEVVAGGHAQSFADASALAFGRHHTTTNVATNTYATEDHNGYVSAGSAHSDSTAR